MRTSILAMIVAFGMGATPAMAQQQSGPNQEMQDNADQGIATRNSGASGYISDQEKPGASAHPPGQPDTKGNQTTAGKDAQQGQTAQQPRDESRDRGDNREVGRDWRIRPRYSDRDERGDRGMYRDDRSRSDRDDRTVGQNWRMERDNRGDRDWDRRDQDASRNDYYEDRGRQRVKTCVEYENGDEYCRYR